MPDFAAVSLPITIAVFVVAAAAVWIAGTRITGYADAISKKTGVGQALLGLLLLAGVTSLPEIGVTVSAAATGNAALAVNNLFGSITMQVAVLAVVDFFVGRRALTSIVPDPAILLLATLNILLLSLAAAGIVVGDVAFIGVGIWAWACLVGYVLSVWLLSQAQGRRSWLAATEGRRALPQRGAASERDESKRSFRSLLLLTAAAAAAILVAGFLLARTGDAIAQQTGLGSSFVGFVFLATSTSLPEFSTALAAARRGLFTMAISDILGTNLINVGLLFLVDAVAPGGPVLSKLGTFAIFGVMLAVALTAILLIGLVERRDRTVARLGYDSVAVMIAYLGGLILLYNLR